MKTILTLLLGLSSGFLTAAFGTTIEKSFSAHFANDEFVLDRASLLELREFVKDLDLNQDYEIVLTGHTDDNGSDDYNLQLSEKRTKFIKYSLQHYGVDPEVVSISWKGEKQPRRPNRDDGSRAVNRRVDVSVRIYQFGSTEELQDALSNNEKQEFVIDPTVPQTIRGEKGVLLTVRPGSFVDRNGNPVTEPIVIKLKEALDYSSFALNKLSTLAGDELLESGGMIYLEAMTESGVPVRIAEDNPLGMLIPTAERADGMELFVSDQGDNWQPVGQPAMGSISFTMPERPYRPSWNFIGPKLVIDRSRKPVKPKTPDRPLGPHKPRHENYAVEPTFVNKLFWKKKTAEAEQRYEEHLADYNERMKSYEGKKELYEQEMKEYPSEMEVYEAAFEEWETYVANASLHHRESDKYQAALKAYEQDYQMKVAKYREKLEAWNCERETKLLEAGEQADQLGFTSRQVMDNYVFGISKLGWINCDRFMNTPPEKRTTLVAADPDTSKEVVLLVFTQIKSMIGLYRKDDSYRMNNYPLDQEAEIFAYKVVDGQPMLCRMPVSGRSMAELEFRPTKFKEIKKILESFEGQNRTS